VVAGRGSAVAKSGTTTYLPVARRGL